MDFNHRPLTFRTAEIVTFRDPYSVDDLSSKDGFEPPTTKSIASLQPWPLDDLLD